jgi:hypothetical protein
VESSPAGAGMGLARSVMAATLISIIVEFKDD